MFARPKPTASKKEDSSSSVGKGLMKKKIEPLSTNKITKKVVGKSMTPPTSSTTKSPLKSSNVRSAFRTDVKNVLNKTPSRQPLSRRATVDSINLNDIEDSLDAEIEELYCEYLQSELILLNAQENHDKAIQDAEKEMLSSFVSLDKIQEEKCIQLSMLDELRFLKDFLEKRLSQINDLNEIKEVLPKVAKKLASLANTLEQNMNYIKISGVSIQNDEENSPKKIQEVLDSALKSFENIESNLQTPKEVNFSSIMNELKETLDNVLDIHRDCDKLIYKLEVEKIKEKSLRFGQEFQNANLELLSFDMFSPVEEPKLVDI